MSSITALKYYRSLTESKIPSDEAYAQASAFDEAIVDLATKKDLEELATKMSDLHELALATKTDLQVLAAQINAKFDTIRTLGWGMFGVIVMMLGVIMKMGGIF